MSGGAFGEPWEVEASPAHVEIMRADRLRTCVAEVYAPEDQPVGRAELVRDFGRAVACVNACAGLADPSVVPELVAFLDFIPGPPDDADSWDGMLACVEALQDVREAADALLARIGGEG